MTHQQRTALDAVAKQFSAKWEMGRGPAGPHLVVAGKPIAVALATLKSRSVGPGDSVKPRLRFDKVVTRLMKRLQGTLSKSVPDGTTVVLSVTAPIRLPSKTAAALEDKIPTLLGQGSRGHDEKITLNGNRVQIRILKDQSERAPKLIGFVHNPDVEPQLLLNLAGELLELFGTKTGQRAKRLAGDRWLVVISTRGIACLEAYRSIYSQLRMATGFQKILVVFGGGQVGTLTGVGRE